MIWPRLTVNSATRWIALSCRSARPFAAHACQYVVPTISDASRTSPTTATRVIWSVHELPSTRELARRVRPVRDEQEAREQDEVGDDARPAVADERERDPGQRDDPQDAADDDERLQREAEREPEREQLREAVLGEHRDPESAQAEEHVDEQQRRRADQPELLGERRVDEVGVQVRDQVVPVRGREDALAEPLAAKPPFPIE